MITSVVPVISLRGMARACLGELALASLQLPWYHRCGGALTQALEHPTDDKF